MKDFVRRGRSNSGSGPAPSLRSVKAATRMSILPSVKFTLRRQDPSDPPPNNKPPLLTLSLSSRSFLDSSVQDATTHEVFYKFNTVGTSTTISRCDAKKVFHKTISIKWPRALPTKTGKDYTDGVLIQMKNARWYGGETLLKLGAHPNASRKFSIPNYSQALKWKRYGQTYWCTTASVRGPVATLDATKGPEPLKLTIYETLHDKYDPDALAGFKGVSILLLDYLLLTSMLLVTDLQEWMLVRKAEDGSLELAADANGQGPSFAPDVPFRSDPKFRKILYGEPIFSKTRPSADRSASPSPVRAKERSRPRRSRSRSPPRTPATPESGMPTFAPYPESEASSPGPSSRITTLLPAMTDSDDEDDEDDEFDTFSLPDPHRASALAESFQFAPAMHGVGASVGMGAAEANYYSDRPPVPPLPMQYAKSFVSRDFRSQPPTPISGTFVPSCEPPLPLPPSMHHIADLISRPRSSPPLHTVDTIPDSNSTDRSSSILHGGGGSAASNHDDALSVTHSHAHSRSDSRSYPEALEHPRGPAMGRAESIRSYTSTTSRTGVRRPLPRPPPVPSVSVTAAPPPTTPGPRRVQSSSQLATYPAFPSEGQGQQLRPQTAQTRPQRSLPPTPGVDSSLPSSPLASSSTHTHEQYYYPASSSSTTSHPNPNPTSTSTTSTQHPSPSLTNPHPLPQTQIHLLLPGSEHSRQPPITKASQEDLASYVHVLTVTSAQQRDLPPEPLPSTSIFDVPPPAYNTIVFSSSGGGGAGAGGASAAGVAGGGSGSGSGSTGEEGVEVDAGTGHEHGLETDAGESRSGSASISAHGHGHTHEEDDTAHYASQPPLSLGQELYQHYSQHLLMHQSEHEQAQAQTVPQPIQYQYQYTRRPTLADVYDSAVVNTP